MATEDALHTDKNHVWHMEAIRQICTGDEKLLLATPYKVVDLANPAECEGQLIGGLL